MARYSDSLLTDGEVVVYRGKQHWLSLVLRGRSGMALLILAVVLFVVVFILPDIFPSGTLQQKTGLSLGAILLIIAAVVLFYRWWQWSNQDYVITNRRMIKVTGIFNKHSADSSLEKINDAILDQPVLGRMLNYGDLSILTAAEEAVDTYHMINDPKHFKKVMLTEKHQLETGMMYQGGMPPTPPLRADVTPAAPQPVAPQPVAQVAPAPVQTAQPTEPTPPAPPPMPPTAPLASDPAPAASEAAAEVAAEPDSSLEVTQTLARLADLRDSGAITAEEYEAKKQELLGRL